MSYDFGSFRKLHKSLRMRKSLFLTQRYAEKAQSSDSYRNSELIIIEKARFMNSSSVALCVKSQRFSAFKRFNIFLCKIETMPLFSGKGASRTRNLIISY